MIKVPGKLSRFSHSSVVQYRFERTELKNRYRTMASLLMLNLWKNQPGGPQDPSKSNYFNFFVDRSGLHFL